jgi:hypothetical protein
MRTIAERLILALTARAPEIVFASFNIDAEGRVGCSDGVAHLNSLHFTSDCFSLRLVYRPSSKQHKKATHV